MLTISPEQIDAIKSNADAAMAFSNIVYSSLERLTTINLNATRALLEESAAASSLMLEASGTARPGKAAKAIPEAATQKAVAYFQGVQELATETQQELARLMTSYLATQGQVTNPGVVWLKGFDAFNSLGQQFGAITEANRKTVADVTSRLAGATASHSAKRA